MVNRTPPKTIRKAMKERVLKNLRADMVYEGKAVKSMNGFAHLTKMQCGKSYSHASRWKQ